MSKPKSPKPNLSASPDPLDNPWPARLTQLAFILSLALVIARAFMSESVREAFDFTTVGGETTPRGPGPAASLTMDALCCVPALLVLARRVVDREYVLRWAWSQVFFALFAIWATLSVFWSADKFTATVTASHMLAAAAIIWAAAQLVRSTLRLRIVAGICFGILLAYLTHALMFRLLDVPENIEYWKSHKQEILQQRSWQPDSFEAKQFEKKLTSGEAVGFNQSPNSFAAVIVMLLVVSAGAAIQRGANRDGVGWIVPVALAAIVSFVVLYFTGSRTAFGTVLIAATMLALLAPLRPHLAKHPTKAYALGVGAFLLAWVLLIAHGVYHRSLPQDSLNFRWRYWVAAAQIVKHHPLLGVGWSNFGNAYLAYRLPAAAEEVRDPHNYIVRAFSELGIVGGAILLAWLLRLTWELTRRAHPPLAPPQKYPASALAITLASALLGGMLLNILASVDFSQSGSFLLLEIFRRILWIGLIAVGAILLIIRSIKAQEIDDRPAPWLIAALLIALFVFFIHNLIDFSLAEPGPLTMFALLVGAAEGVTAPPLTGKRKRRTATAVALAVSVILWIVAIGAFVIPLSSAEDQAHAADDAMRANQPARAAGLLRNALATMPLNADYAYRAAHAMMQPGRSPQEIRAMLDTAIAKDPSNVGYYLTRGGYEMTLPPDLRDPQAARHYFEQALRRDPMNVAARIDYADALEKLGDPKEAARELREALRRNDQLNPDEPKRLSPQRVREIEDRARKLESASTA